MESYFPLDGLLLTLFQTIRSWICSSGRDRVIRKYFTDPEVFELHLLLSQTNVDRGEG